MFCFPGWKQLFLSWIWMQAPPWPHVISTYILKDLGKKIPFWRIHQHHPERCRFVKRCWTFIHVSARCIRVQMLWGRKKQEKKKTWVEADLSRCEDSQLVVTDVETKALIFEPRQPEASLNEEIAAEQERGHPGCQSQASGPLVVNCPLVKPCCRGATG